jgi:hypothetical protein
VLAACVSSNIFVALAVPFILRILANALCQVITVGICEVQGERFILAHLNAFAITLQ